MIHAAWGFYFDALTVAILAFVTSSGGSLRGGSAAMDILAAQRRRGGNAVGGSARGGTSAAAMLQPSGSFGSRSGSLAQEALCRRVRSSPCSAQRERQICA